MSYVNITRDQSIPICAKSGSVSSRMKWQSYGSLDSCFTSELMQLFVCQEEKQSHSFLGTLCILAESILPP